MISSRFSASSHTTNTSSDVVLDEVLLNHLKALLQQDNANVPVLINRALLREFSSLNVLNEIGFLTQKEKDQILSCLLISIIINADSVEKSIDSIVLKKVAQSACTASAYLQQSAQSYVADNIELYAKLKKISYLLLSTANILGFVNRKNEEEGCHESLMYAFLYLFVDSKYQIDLSEDLQYIKHQASSANLLTVPLFHTPQRLLDYVDSCDVMSAFSTDFDALIRTFEHAQISRFSMTRLYEKSLKFIMDTDSSGGNLLSMTHQDRRSQKLRQHQEKNIYVMPSKGAPELTELHSHKHWRYFLEHNLTLSLATLLSYNESDRAINVNVFTDNLVVEDDKQHSVVDAWIEKLQQTLELLQLKKWKPIILEMGKIEPPKLRLATLIFQHFWGNLTFFEKIKRAPKMAKFIRLSLWKKYGMKLLGGAVVSVSSVLSMFAASLYMGSISPFMAANMSAILMIESVLVLFIVTHFSSFCSQPYKRFLMTENKTHEENRNNGGAKKRDLNTWENWQEDVELLLSVMHEQQSSASFHHTLVFIVKNIEQYDSDEMLELWLFCDDLAQYEGIEMIKMLDSNALNKRHEDYLWQYKSALQKGFTLYLNAQENLEDIASDVEIKRLRTVHHSVLDIDEALVIKITNYYMQQRIDVSMVNNFSHLLTLCKICQYIQPQLYNSKLVLLSVQESLAILHGYLDEKEGGSMAHHQESDSMHHSDIKYLLKHFIL